MIGAGDTTGGRWISARTSATYVCVRSYTAAGCPARDRNDARGIAQVSAALNATCCLRKFASYIYVGSDTAICIGSNSATSCPMRARIDAKGISQVCGAASLTNRLGKSAPYVDVGSKSAHDCTPSGRIDARGAQVYAAIDGACCLRNSARYICIWSDNATGCPKRGRIDAKGISQVCGATSLTN